VLSRKQYDGNRDTGLNVYVNVEARDISREWAAFYPGLENYILFAVPAGSDKLDKNEYSRKLDVVAHEFTHAVSSATWNNQCALNPNTEAGNINEALSDIMGEMVERYVTGTNDWQIVDRDFSKGLANVNNFADALKSLFGMKTDEHENALIIDYVAYVIATGNGTGEIRSEYASSRIPWLVLSSAEKEDDSAAYCKLWYGTMNMLPPNPTFSQFAHAAIRMVELMYEAGRISKERMELVSDAFASVDITPSPSYDGYASNKDTVDKIVAPYRLKPNVEEESWMTFGQLKQKYHEDLSPEFEFHRTYFVKPSGVNLWYYFTGLNDWQASDGVRVDKITGRLGDLVDGLDKTVTIEDFTRDLYSFEWPANYTIDYGQPTSYYITDGRFAVVHFALEDDHGTILVGRLSIVLEADDMVSPTSYTWYQLVARH
jgi:hypothetical protein